MVTMTKKDYDAIGEKLDNPQKIVKCPRCGKSLIYEERGNSIAVECETKGCIYGGIRGI